MLQATKIRFKEGEMQPGIKNSAVIIVAIISLVSLSACGGGGGGTPTSQSVSGVAATGAAINGGPISLRDASGHTKTAVTDASGNYSVDITGLTGPFLLRVHPAAGADLFSYATGSGTANIHPFTDLIVRNRFALSGQDNTDALFAQTGAIVLPTSAQISTVKDNVANLIYNQLVMAGIAPSHFDFFTTSFTPGSHSLFDNVLDAVKVIISAGTATINVNSSPIASFSLSASPPSYSTSDLSGTWYSSLVSSGTASEWCRSKFIVDSVGKFTMLENLCSDNDTSLSPDINGAITSGGEVTFPALASYNGYMSKTKDFVFMTSTSGGSTYQFNVFNKLDNSVSFSNADLTGTWYSSLISSGTVPEWCRSKFSVDSAAKFTMLENLCSDGDTTLSPAINGAITSGGEVTFPAFASYRGYMSRSKDLVFMTSTSGGSTYQFNIFNKLDNSVSFSNADLEGTWNAHLFVSGTGAQWVGWAHGTINVNSSGGTAWTTITRSNGNSTLPAPGTLSITASGVVSDPGVVSSQGVMSQDKKTIVVTMRDGGGGYALTVLQK